MFKNYVINLVTSKNITKLLLRNAKDQIEGGGIR